MKLNLNDPSDLSVDGVRRLLASEEDTQNWQLRVSSEGIAYLSSEVGNINTDGLAFRMETWLAGNGYVGKAASEDIAWVHKVYNSLRENWPNPEDEFIDW